ncbi:hypothetical protein Tco_1101325 [Tanacetum coccineum]
MSSDSASSEVTYTSISSHGDPLAWAVDFFRLQEPDSPEAAPTSPNYHVFPAEEQPLPPVDSPTALSLEYVDDSDPEEDPEEDSEEEHVDYLADGGDDDDDDDDTDDQDKKPFKEEEEEHLAPADHFDVPVPSAEDTEAFEADELVPAPPSPLAYHTTARISIRPEAPILLPPEEEVKRLLALPTPPPSPLISLSPLSAEERLARCLAAPALPTSPLPRLPHPYGSPNHMRAPPGFRAAMGRLRASSPLPPLVPTLLPLSSPPLLPLPPSPLPLLPDSLYKVGESSTAVPRPTGGHRVDYRFIGTMEAEAKRQRAETVGYGIRDTWVDPREIAKEVAPVTLERVNTKDHHINAQESQIAALTAQVSSLQGHLATALGEIRELQAREQALADVPEDTGSSS